MPGQCRDRAVGDLEPGASFQNIGHLAYVIVEVERRNADCLRIEQLAQALAHQFEYGLLVELVGQAPLHAIDDCQFGRPVLGLLQETLGLVEQAGILEGDAHRRGHGLQQPHLGLAVGVLALMVFEDDAAQDTVAANDGHGHK